MAFLNGRVLYLGDTAYKRMNGGSTQEVTEADGTVTTRYDNVYDLRMSRKSKNQLLLSQPMGEMGSLSLSWDQQTYWNTPKSTQGLQFAWNNTYRNVSVGLNFQRSTSLYDNKRTTLCRCPCPFLWAIRPTQPAFATTGHRRIPPVRPTVSG